MCVVSNMGDHYTDKFNQPDWLKFLGDPNAVSRTEFNELKKQVEEMKAILIKAKLYDDSTGQPDCYMENKVKALKEVAKLFGIDLEEIFKPKA